MLLVFSQDRSKLVDVTDLASEMCLNVASCFTPLLLRYDAFVSLLMVLCHLCTTAKLKFSCKLDNSVFQSARLVDLAVVLQARLTVSALVTRLFFFTQNARWLSRLA